LQERQREMASVIATYRDVFYTNPDAPIRCVTLESPARAPVQLLSAYDLIQSVLDLKNARDKWARAIKQRQLPDHFQSSLHCFDGGRKDEPVVDGVNAVVLLTSINSRKGNELKQEYNRWICQVLAGSTDIQDTITANAERAEDPSTFNSTVLPAVKGRKINITYLVSCENRPCCYLRVNPRTYEVFALEYNTLLPQCPELGDDLKFGHAQNLGKRESSYEHGGVFVFFVTLSSIDDARILETALKNEYGACRRDGKLEYLSFPLLQKMMKELKAKNILEKVKAKIMELISELTFIHSLHVGIFSANTITQTHNGIAVEFTESEVPCHGRLKDREYKALLQEKDGLIKENLLSEV
jgi:hypothetical protein